MTLIKMILKVIQKVILSKTPNRSLTEALIKFDFKIEDSRQNLMQLSFSPLANISLFLLLGFLMIEPTQNYWSLTQLIQKFSGEDSKWVYFFFDAQNTNLFIFGSVFFILEWFLKKEYFLIALIFYFLNKSELHLHLALASLFGVYFSRVFYLWKMHFDLESQSRKIFKTTGLLTIIATFLAFVFILMFYAYLRRENYFSNSISQNRSAFFVLSICIYQMLIFLFLSTWGHFYFKTSADPSELPICFSTSNWIKKWKFSSKLQLQLHQKITDQLKSHQNSISQIQQMKDQGLGRALELLEPTLIKEIAYLKNAASQLTPE